jgi:hypothetical protein
VGNVDEWEEAAKESCGKTLSSESAKLKPDELWESVWIVGSV